MTAWVLVPREPTEAMILALLRAEYDQKSDAEQWVAMLAAAPGPPPDPRDALIERLTAALQFSRGFVESGVNVSSALSIIDDTLAAARAWKESQR